MVTGSTKASEHCRFCSCGCGKPLLDAEGTPDFSRVRRFATKQCLQVDKARRVAARRARLAFQNEEQQKISRHANSPVKVNVQGQELVVPSAKAAFELVRAHGSLGVIELVKGRQGRPRKKTESRDAR